MRAQCSAFNIAIYIAIGTAGAALVLVIKSRPRQLQHHRIEPFKEQIRFNFNALLSKLSVPNISHLLIFFGLLDLQINVIADIYVVNIYINLVI